MKKLLLRFCQFPAVARFLTLWALRGHNFSYRVAGRFSPVLEPDGVHPKHRLMRYHDWFTERLMPAWHVLDVGCGNGALAVDLKAVCCSVVAIDINPANIAKAQKKFAGEGISYLCGDATTYRFERGFDAIVLSNVLEHIDGRVEFLRRLLAIHHGAGTSPVLLIRVPLLTRDWITLYKQERGVEWRLDATHCIEYREEDFFAEMAAAGLRVTEYRVSFGELYAVAVREMSV
ncbi:MAG: class I SAM-dependent methyltransferase [Thermodesulfobacteriota bacterium]